MKVFRTGEQLHSVLSSCLVKYSTQARSQASQSTVCVWSQLAELARHCQSHGIVELIPSRSQPRNFVEIVNESVGRQSGLFR
jgi:hypothetical protein